MKIPIFLIFTYFLIHQRIKLDMESLKTEKQITVDTMIAKNKMRNVRCMIFPYFQ